MRTYQVRESRPLSVDLDPVELSFVSVVVSGARDWSLLFSFFRHRLIVVSRTRVFFYLLVLFHESVGDEVIVVDRASNGRDDIAFVHFCALLSALRRRDN